MEILACIARKESDSKIIKSIISNNRFIKDRVEAALNFYDVEEKAMGSGGVGQIKVMRSGITRIQIGFGHGRNNYAMCVILPYSLIEPGETECYI